MHADYIATLSAGKHTIKFIFTDGYSEIVFTVFTTEEDATAALDEVPTTGESNVLLLVLIIEVFTALSVFGYVVLNRKKQ